MIASSVGAWRLATSSADVHAASLRTPGTLIWRLRNAESKSSRTGVALFPSPIRQVTLMSGRDLLPPKFLGEWNNANFLFALAAKITVSISLTRSFSFASFKKSASRVLLKAWRFWYPVSLLSPSRLCMCGHDRWWCLLLELLTILVAWTGCLSGATEKRGGNETSSLSFCLSSD